MYGSFNNREIASALWLLVFLIWTLQTATVRKSIVDVVRIFFSFNIIVPVCLMALYSAVSIVLLSAASIWKIALLKDTIVWFCVSAIPMMMRGVLARDDENIFVKILVDSFKVAILLEFLVNTYTFSLPAELAITLLVTLIAIVGIVASSDKKTSGVARFSQGMQTIIGLIILCVVFSRAISDLRNLTSLDTVRSIILIPLLSTLLSPFIYIVVLISKYELIFLRLGTEKDKRLKRYARRCIILHVGFSLTRLHLLLRSSTFDLMHIQTEADIDRLLQSSTDS